MLTLSFYHTDCTYYDIIGFEMKRRYKKPSIEYIIFDYSVVASQSDIPVDPVPPPDDDYSAMDYYRKDGKLFTEDELSDFLNDETPF